MEVEYPKVHAAPSSAHCPEAGRSTGIAALGCGAWHAATSGAALSNHPVDVYKRQVHTVHKSMKTGSREACRANRARNAKAVKD